MRPIDADAFKKYIDAQEGRPFIGCTVGEAMKILIDEQPTIQPEKAQLSQEDETIVAKSKRTFVELLVHYPHPDVCTYPEYKGKPYYSIKYIEDGECFVGFGTYKPEVLSQYLRDYFMPSAQPEWNNHTVACLLAELFDDTCACNYNGIDEWLPEKCELLDSCPHPVGVACWEQFLKHKAERRTDE